MGGKKTDKYIELIKKAQSGKWAMDADGKKWLLMHPDMEDWVEYHPDMVEWMTEATRFPPRSDCG